MTAEPSPETQGEAPPGEVIGRPADWRWRAAFWVVLFVALMLAVDALSAVLLPFVAGMAAAYFLDPVADWLEERGLSRTAATSLITAAFVGSVVAGLLVIGPFLLSQVETLAELAPQWIAAAREMLEDRFGPSEDWFAIDGLSASDAPTGEAMGAALRFVVDALQRLISGAVSIANLLSLIFITPIVTFYLLRDWDRMVARIRDLAPHDSRPVVGRLAGEIDRTLSAFVRGTGTVCLTLGAFYAIALTLAGLQLGILIGLLAGLISFIPFVGSLVGAVASIGVALFQFDDPIQIGVIAAIFAIGQVIEGNVLTPKLVGGSVGLHPVWVIFAMLAGGALFGFVGVMMAVPVAAASGVLVRYVVEEYRDSAIYRGHLDDAPDAE